MIHGAPHYTYNLPCGHTVRSYTVALPADDGWVWLWCNPCDAPVALTIRESRAIEVAPRRVNGSRMGEADVSRRIDESIIRERIVRLLNGSNGKATDREMIAACAGVSRSTITSVREFWRQQRGSDGAEDFEVAA